MSECPCRYCEERSIECHGKCKKYRKWSAINIHISHIKNKKLNEERIYKEDKFRKKRRRK